MRTLFYTLILAILSSFFNEVKGQWRLVWQDEFNGSGLPDPNKWGYDTGNGGWGNNELQNYTANRTENARQENGNLVIEARRDWYNGIEYSSARLVSRNKGDWKYGRIEVKAKIPLGQGLWPAIWMLPTDWVYGGWPASGEIDIMENFALGGIKPNSIEGNIHTQAYNHSIGTNKGSKSQWLSNIQDNYHVYAVNWYADRLEFQVDGQTYFTFQNEGNWQAWPFDQRFHLILNIAVGGTLGTTPDPNIFPKQMLVDYVRVYEVDNGPAASTGLITSYADCNFSGFSGGFELGQYTTADLVAKGVSDNSLSSIKVPEGFKAILYDGDNFTGSTLEVTSDNSCVGAFNDKTSSIKIICNGDPNLAGSYFLENKNSGLYLDVAGGPPATTDGVNIFQYGFNGMTNQEFTLTHLGEGVYQILAKHSGKSIDVDGLGKANGTNVHQWTYYGTANQQFVLYPASPGYYKVIDKNSGKLVEVAGASLSEMANVQIWDNNNQDCGQWKLVPPVVTGLEEVETQVKIYPNPAAEVVNFVGMSSAASLEVTDARGAVLYVGKAEVLNISDWPAGVYWVRIWAVDQSQILQLVKP